MKTSLKRRLTQGLAITLPGLVLAGALTGCATPPPKSDTADYQAYQQLNDPLEPTNRVFFKINNKLDTYVMKPVAKGLSLIHI